MNTPPLVSGLPVLGNALQLARDPGQFWVRAARRYGHVFRVRWPTAPAGEMYAICGREANLLAQREGRDLFVTRPYYRHLCREVGTDDYMCALDGDRHRHFRRAMAPALSREVVRPFVPELVDIMRERIASWQGRAALPMFEALQRATVDLLSVVASGSAIPDDAYASLARYAKTFVGSGVAGRPAFLFSMPGYKKARRAVDEFLEHRLDEHERQPPRSGRKPDVMDVVLAAHDPDGNPLPRADRVANAHLPYANGFIYGGRVSAFLLYALLANPGVLERVRAEVAAWLDGAGPTLDGLRYMSVTRNAIRETHRRYPIAPAVPRYATRDFDFGGCTVPRGSYVMVAMVVPHFDPALFAEPLAFDPDRFAPPRSEHRLQGAFNPYGLGSHACPSGGLIETIVHVAVACVVHWADLELVPPNYVVRQVLDPVPGPDGSFRVRIARRDARQPPAAAEPGSPFGTLIAADASPRELDRVLGGPVRRRLEAGEVLFEEGADADDLYVVMSGGVVVERDLAAGTRELARLGPGACVGEIGLLHGVPRTARVRAVDGGAVLLAVSRQAFLALVADKDLTGTEIAEIARRRSLANQLLERLSDLDPAVATTLQGHATSETFEPGAPVVHQGDPATHFYVVVSGEAEVVNHHRNGEDLHLATLGPGDWFGEIGLLTGRPRTATVRASAAESLSVIAFDADGFRLLTKADGGLETELGELAAKRLAELERLTQA
jgi:cytochrome P450/CRP-like cAMP-binding protein